MARLTAAASFGARTWAIVDGPSCRLPFRPLIDVTIRGFIRSPPLATVDATSAIWNGVTNVSPWPYAAFASSTSSTNPPGAEPDPFVTCDDAVGRSNGIGEPNPSRSAYATSCSPPVSSPVRAYQILQDTSVA